MAPSRRGRVHASGKAALGRQFAVLRRSITDRVAGAYAVLRWAAVLARHDPVVDHLIALLAPLAEPEAQRMFGVRGVYLDGPMVDLVRDGRVYLKAGAENT